MSDPFEDLKELLSRYEGCYREILDLQVRERDCLTRLDMAALEANNNRKETLALQVKTLEEARLQLCEQIGTELGVPASEVTVGFLAARCRPELAAAFQRFADVFRALARDIAAVGETNQKLVQSSLATTRNLERLLRRLFTDQPTYRPTGELDVRRQNSRLIERTL